MHDLRLSINTRGGWRQWIHEGTPLGEGGDVLTEAERLGGNRVTSRMIELGVAEFLRFRGGRTIEVTVQSDSSTRMMVWRGTEEVRVDDAVGALDLGGK